MNNPDTPESTGAEQTGQGMSNLNSQSYPWLVALCYEIFGYHEEIARVIPYLLSLFAVIYFFKLASLLLPRNAAVAALAVFAVNPMAVEMAPAIQPEPIMFFFYIAGIYHFIKWWQLEHKVHYWLSLLCTVLAILSKLPAIHVGLLFLFLSLSKYGNSAFFRKDLISYALLTLCLTVLWYGHAKSLWIDYGNSLGMSNEAYLRVGVVPLLRALPSIVIGLLKIETKYIWTPLGIFLGIWALMVNKKDALHKAVWYWLVALCIFYILTGRTTGQSWAYYYHIISAPLASLLIGFGFMQTRNVYLNSRNLTILAIVIMVLGIPFLGAKISNILNWKMANDIVMLGGFTMVLTGILLLVRANFKLADGNMVFSSGLWMTVLQTFCFAGTLVFSVWVIGQNWRPTEMIPAYNCAKNFEDKVTNGSLIAVSSPSGLDEYGMPRANNTPYLFYWMNRKGFTVAMENQTLEYLEDLRARGARYLVAEKLFLRADFEKAVRSRFKLLDECEPLFLLDLGEEKDALAGKK